MSVKVLNSVLPSASADFKFAERVGSTAQIFMNEFGDDEVVLASVDNSFDPNSRGTLYVGKSAVQLYMDGAVSVDVRNTNTTIGFGGASIALQKPAADTIMTALADEIKISDGGVGREIGVFGAAPIVQQVGVPVTSAGIHAALVAYGWITA